jgi:hypothetical protein
MGVYMSLADYHREESEEERQVVGRRQWGLGNDIGRFACCILGGPEFMVSAVSCVYLVLCV